MVTAFAAGVELQKNDVLRCDWVDECDWRLSSARDFSKSSNDASLCNRPTLCLTIAGLAFRLCCPHSDHSQN